MFNKEQKTKVYDYEKIIRLAEELKRMTQEETRNYGRYDLHERMGNGES